MNPMPELDQLIDDLAAEGAPVRTHSTSAGRIGLALASVATLAVTALLYDGRGHGPTFVTSPVLAVAAGLTLVMALAAGTGALRMARPQVGAAPSPASWILAALLVVPLVAILQVAILPALAPGLDAGPGLHCLMNGLLFGLGSCAFLVFWLRRGAPVAPERAAWLVGLASGAIGSLAVGFKCPIDLLAHVGVWHIAAVPVAGLLARIALPPLLRW